MEIRELLFALRESDIDISLYGDNLKLSTNQKQVPQEFLEKIKHYKKDIINYLKNKNNLGSDESKIKTVDLPVEDGYILSPLQTSLYFLSHLDSANIAYNIPSVYSIEGKLDIACLEKSFELVIKRHESLRTVFKQVEVGEIRQFIESYNTNIYKIKFSDLRESDLSNEKIQNIIESLFAKSFDLSLGPLIQINLLQIEDEKYLLCYVIHHIVSDGWSMDILINDLMNFYNSFYHNQSVAFNDKKIQYKDYVYWIDNQLKDKYLLNRDYWLKQFEDGIPIVDLPHDKPRNRMKTYKGAIVQRSFETTLFKHLQSTIQNKDCTLFMGLLTVVYILIKRYTNNDDIVIGTPIAGRDEENLENVVGLFVNVLPLRIRINETHSFLEILADVKKNVLEAFNYQFFPFFNLVKELKIERSAGRNPLFDVEVLLKEIDPDNFLKWQKLGSAKVSNYNDAEYSFSKFDLSFYFEKMGSDLSLNIEYNTDIFNRDFIIRMAGHVEQLLNSIMHKSNAPIAQLNYLSSDERSLLLNMVGNQVSIDSGETFINLFEKQVKKMPENIAVSFLSGNLTYKQLNNNANRLANFFINKIKLCEQSKVGVLLQRNIDLLITMLASWKASCIYVPFDESWPEDRLLFLLEEACIEVLIVSKHYSVLAHRLLRRCNKLQYIIYIDSSNLSTDNIGNEIAENIFCANDILECSELNIESLVRPENLSYIIFTSGSTGVPKGVMVEHRGMLNHLYAKVADFGIDEHSNIAQTSTQVFDVSIWQFVTGLLVGGRTTVLNDEDAWEPARLLSAIQMHGITILESVPAHFSLILDYLSHVGSLPALDSLCYLVMNGEALPVSYSRRWFDYYPSIQMANVYGPTECSDDITHFIFSSCSDSWDAYVPIGKPIGNMHLYVLDELLNPVARGIAGELYASGPGVGRGYLNDEEKTAAFFINNPYSEGRVSYHERLYKTGDLVKWLDDGNLSYIGRRDGQIKIRGNRVESGEVEVVMQEYIGIGQVVVIADDENNSGEKRLVAYIVCKGDKFDRKELQGYLRGKLPEYMIPAVIVEMESLPLTINGKVNRKALPNAEATDLTTDNYEAPRNELETKIAEIWQDILKVEKVGIYDNFFELGGHSLLALKLQSEITRQFKIAIPLKILFQKADIDCIAKYIGLMQSRQQIVSGENSFDL